MNKKTEHKKPYEKPTGSKGKRPTTQPSRVGSRDAAPPVLRAPVSQPARKSGQAGKRGNKAEVKYYGVHACLELIRKRRDATIRAYVSEAQLPQFKKYLSWCATTKRAYHVVSDEELAVITQSVHHEGVCILAEELLPLSFHDFLASLPRQLTSTQAPLLYLAGTGNPHNVGALMRTAAHFGVAYMLVEAKERPRVAGALARISKGGCEHVQLVELPAQPEAALRELERRGYALVSTSAKAKTSLYEFTWSQPAVLMLGHESRGVAEKIARLASHHVVIPGSGAVESLNVSVAGALLLSEWYRRRP